MKTAQKAGSRKEELALYLNTETRCSPAFVRELIVQEFCKIHYFWGNETINSVLLGIPELWIRRLTSESAHQSMQSQESPSRLLAVSALALAGCLWGRAFFSGRSR
jgi:hypothetical protein